MTQDNETFYCPKDMQPMDQFQVKRPTKSSDYFPPVLQFGQLIFRGTAKHPHWNIIWHNIKILPE